MRTVSMPHRPGRHKGLPTHKGMHNMLDMLKTYMDAHWYREEGATAIEYGLLAALIAVAIIGALIAVGGGLNNIFNQVAGQLGGGGAGGGGS